MLSVASFMNEVNNVIYIASLLLFNAWSELDIGVFMKNSKKKGASMRI